MNRNRILLLTVLIICLAFLAGCQSGSSDRAEGDDIVHADIEQGESGENHAVDEFPKAIPASGDQTVLGAGSERERLEEITVRYRRPPAKFESRVMLSANAQPLPSIAPMAPPVDRETYANFDDNPVKQVQEAPVSTFSVDVDTGSYTNVRRMLNAGSMPPHDAVRVEEMINYFDYHYAGPAHDVPFHLVTELAPSPWREGGHLLHIGIQGYEPPADERKAANLVFLIDVSGSMDSADKLGLLKQSMKLLTRQLTADDRVAIAVYAGAAGQVLASTSGDKKAAIASAIDRLSAGGSTNGGAGIDLAYALASDGFIDGGINRVILATDGDFNVGTTDFESLKSRVENRRKSGVALTALGFGRGNYNDHLMEQLADAGNGNYFYIDTLREGRKVLAEELTATLQIIAKDVKVQIEFNPAVVAEYRLVGYENRQLRREDFNNDQVDAGDIGAGHSVTALYELTMVGDGQPQIDPLRYDQQRRSLSDVSGEIGYLKLRYKRPEAERSQMIRRAIVRGQQLTDLSAASESMRFATAVAGFGQLLRGGERAGRLTLEDVVEQASAARGDDHYGYRAEFLSLVRLAQSLDVASNSSGSDSLPRR